MPAMCLRLLVLLAVLSCLANICRAVTGVTIAPQDGGYLVTTPTYQTTINASGQVLQLSVLGREFLNNHNSPGAYYWLDDFLAFPSVVLLNDHELLTGNDVASVRYTFAADTMTWTLTNTTSRSMLFFNILDHAATVMRDNTTGAYLMTPINQAMTDSTWFNGSSKLTLTGSDKGWPWQENTVAWEVGLQPGQTRQITLTPAATTAAEAARIDELINPKFALVSPQDYQVFQRRTKTSGTIRVQGQMLAACDRVDARYTRPTAAYQYWTNFYSSWQRLKFDPATGIFSGELNAPAGGWFRTELRLYYQNKIVKTVTVEHVGVGEVFVGAGQSNSTSCGEIRTAPATGMVSTYNGSVWRTAEDPQPGAHDIETNSAPIFAGGSCWPAFGDAMYARYKVPIGVAVTGYGGTSVSQWQPGGENFNWMMLRIHQLGPYGFRAVLWHQGESDVVGKTPRDAYDQMMINLIQRSKATAGWEFPWFVAQATYINADWTSDPTIREAQAMLWANRYALPGPDTDTLTGDNRDYGGTGIHFSPKGLKAHGEMWADCVSKYLATQGY